MATPIGELFVKISTDTKSLNTGLKTATNSVNAFAKNVTSILGVLGVAFAAREVVQYGKHIVNLGDELNALSKRTGLAASELAQLRFVASQSDTSLETLTGSFKFLAKNMSEAAQGSESAKSVFEQFHIEFQNADGTLRNYKDVLLEVADRVKNTSDQSVIMAATQKLLGRGSAELIPLLRQGSAEIQRLTERYKQLGGTPSELDELAKSADEMKDSWDEVSKTMEIVGIKIMKELIPHIKTLAEELVKIDWGGFVEKGIAVVQGGQAILKWFDEMTTRATGLAIALSLVFDKGATFEDLKIAMDMMKTGQMPGSSIPPPDPNAGPNPMYQMPVVDVVDSALPGEQGISAPTEKIEETKSALEDLAESWADVNTQIQEALANTLTMIVEGFGSAIADVIVDGKDFGDAMKELWKGIAKSVIAEIVTMIAKLMILFAWQVITGTVGSGSPTGGGGGKKFLGLFRDGAAIGARNGMVYGAQGFATGPFGEAGIPAVIHPNEIVTPIDKFFDVIKSVGKGNTTVNINGYNQDPRVLSDLVAMEIERERRNV